MKKKRPFAFPAARLRYKTMKKIPDNQIAFYQSPDGSVNIEVLYAEENIWLTQKKMAELFDTTPQNITQHLKNIYAEGEADQTATCKDFLQVQKEGEREVKRNTSTVPVSAPDILMNSTKKLKTSVPANGCSTRKLPIFMPQP